MGEAFARLAGAISRLAGSWQACALALALVLAWAATGPLFAFSDSWELIINTGTTIVTFIMVFVLQNTQTRDTAAIQLKLDVLIAAADNASNIFMHLEDLTEAERAELRRRLG